MLLLTDPIIISIIVRCKLVRVYNNIFISDIFSKVQLSDVGEMLKALNLLEYMEDFKREKLSLYEISKMTHDELKSIGVNDFNNRKYMLDYSKHRILEDKNPPAHTSILHQEGHVLTDEQITQNKYKKKKKKKKYNL